MERWHPIPRPAAPFNTETYDYIGDNPFLDVAQNPLSTFSADVDTASYSNVRRFLERGTLPPKDAVRIEELVNYFDYDYKGPGDDKTAGAIGAGHALTVLYELVPAGSGRTTPAVDPLKYQKPSQPAPAADSNEILTLKIRSKEPEKDKSVLSEFTVRDSTRKFSEAAAVAAFGMVLRGSPHKGSANLENVLEWAKDGRGPDTRGYRGEFIRLIHRALSLSD